MIGFFELFIGLSDIETANSVAFSNLYLVVDILALVSVDYHVNFSGSVPNDEREEFAVVRALLPFPYRRFGSHPSDNNSSNTI